MTVTAKEIQKVIDPRARWIAKCNNGEIRWFGNKPFYKEDHGVFEVWYTNKSPTGSLGKIEVAEFEGKEWTDCCLELEPDYSKWCGCLCYFWDDKEDNLIIGILESIHENQRDNRAFKYQNGRLFKHCRPVRRNEVEFVEDGE